MVWNMALSLVWFCLVWSLFVSVCLCVSVCFCVSISAIYILYVCNAVHDACFSAFIWPFHCIHIAVTKAHAACRRPKSFVRRCTSETILTSAYAARQRPVSFLRMMHHCIMAPGFQPKAHAACRRPKSLVRRCTSEAILTSADAACRRPVSFLRMMLHCIMAPGLRY